LLLGGFVYLVPSGSRAQDLSYREWRFGVGSGVAPLSDELIQSLHAQIDIVESLDIRPEIKTFFRTVPLEIDKTTTGGAGAYSFREHRMFLSTHVDSPENPVFLHELLHAYHDLKLPDGVRNRRIIETYEDAPKEPHLSNRRLHDEERKGVFRYVRQRGPMGPRGAPAIAPRDRSGKAT